MNDAASRKLRVLLVDEQVSVRQMMGALLPGEGDYEPVGEAGTGYEALQQCRALKPDLVVLDLVLPELNGAGLIRELRVRAREVRTIVYSGTRQRALVLDALRARPHGFVLKQDPFSAFQEALRVVAGGCSYLTTFATRVLDDAGDDSQKATQLSQREQAVLQMVAEGSPNKVIGARLGISPKTVEHYRMAVMQKLRLHDVASLTRYAVREGLVTAE